MLTRQPYVRRSRRVHKPTLGYVRWSQHLSGRCCLMRFSDRMVPEVFQTFWAAMAAW